MSLCGFAAEGGKRTRLGDESVEPIAAVKYKDYTVRSHQIGFFNVAENFLSSWRCGGALFSLPFSRPAF